MAFSGIWLQKVASRFTNPKSYDNIQKHKHVFARKERNMEYINGADQAALTELAEAMAKITVPEKERLKAFFMGVRFAADADPKIIKDLANKEV